MPIYEQTYRHYEGRIRHRFRWWIVVQQELSVLAKSKIFMALIFGASIHVILRVLQVVAFDIVIQDPNHPLTPLLQNVQGIMVNERMIFDFIRLQAPVVFIITLYAGAGMICNDFRNNLMEVYFSKPIRWYDYALGKAFALIVLGLSLTALPAIGFTLLHNMLLPSWDLFKETYWWPGAALAFSLTLILPCAMGILACSALLPSQNFAAIAVFMVLIANSGMGGLLATLLQQPSYLLLSFPMAINRVGQYFFGDRRLLFDSHWGWSMLFVALVTLWGAWVVFRKARRAEIAA